MRPAYTKYVYDFTIVTPSLLVSFYDSYFAIIHIQDTVSVHISGFFM